MAYASGASFTMKPAAGWPPPWFLAPEHEATLSAQVVMIRNEASHELRCLLPSGSGPRWMMRGALAVDGNGVLLACRLDAAVRTATAVAGPLDRRVRAIAGRAPPGRC